MLTKSLYLEGTKVLSLSTLSVLSAKITEMQNELALKRASA